MTYSNHTNKQPDTNIIPAGTLIWYWGPLSDEQEQVMLLEDLQKEVKFECLSTVSVLHQTIKKTVWCSNLCVKRFDKKPGINIYPNPCQEIPLEFHQITQTYSGNSITVDSTVSLSSHFDFSKLKFSDETTIK